MEEEKQVLITFFFMKNVYMQHLTAKIPTQQTCYTSQDLMFSQWRY